AEVGVERIREKSLGQTERLIQGGLARGWRVHTPRDPAERGGTVSLDCPHAQEVMRELVARNILVDYRPQAGVRLSPHFYNRDEELDFALGQIEEILRTNAWERHLQKVGGAARGRSMAAGDIRKKFAAQKTSRASQAIFGERQHLAEVLRSVRAAKLPSARQQREVRTLDRFIAERTRELNRITPGWDRKFKKSRDPRTSSRELLRLAAALSSEDYLLARVLTEHAEAPPELLESMASHP